MGCAEESKEQMKQLVRWSLNLIAPCMYDREQKFLKRDDSCVIGDEYYIYNCPL